MDKRLHHVTISINAEKAFDKILPPFMINTLRTPEVKCTSFSLLKSIHTKHTANTILNGERLNAFPLRFYAK